MIRPDETTKAELGCIMDAVAVSAPELAAMPLRTRAAGLLAVAAALEQSRPELVQLAIHETGLAESRLGGELTRTIVQLKLFADVVIAGEYLDARIDEDDQVCAAPTIVSVTADVLKSHGDRLIDEAFGPLSILVGYDEGEDLAALSRELFSGNLTGTIHLGPSEDPSRVRGLAAQLSTSTGRVIFGGWPTGVAVTPAMQHGGPYPATTNDSSTSVGTASISRFLRPVAYQDAPQELLPEPLQDVNPWSVPRNWLAAAIRPIGDSGAKASSERCASRI